MMVPNSAIASAGESSVLTVEQAIRIYRSVKSRRLKAWALAGMRLLSLRHFVIRMDTTNLCNLRCRMCFYSLEEKRQKQEMDIHLFEELARTVFPKTRFLYLSCATEPLMNKSFSQFLDCLGGYHVPFTSFCTNGMLLTESVVDSAIRAGLSEIIFSVDGATAATYEHIRRGAKWDRMLEALDLLRSKKQQARSEKPVARINFTCMACNIRELPDVLPLAAAHGVGSVHVRHLVIPQGEGGDAIAREQLGYRAEFNAIAERSLAVARNLGVHLWMPDPVPDKPHKELEPENHREERNPYCLLPWMQAIIKPSGDYQVCSRLPYFGNLRQQPFDSIYNGDEMRRLRRSMLHRRPDSCAWTCGHEAHAASAKGEQ
jgi:MoaA/NifB/PqqE/SkfB family radical SAM enzyme